MASKKNLFAIPPCQVALPPAPAAAGPAHHCLTLLPASPPWHPPPPPSPPPPLALLLQHHHHRRTLLRHLPRPPHPLRWSTSHCICLHSLPLPTLPSGWHNLPRLFKAVIPNTGVHHLLRLHPVHHPPPALSNPLTSTKTHTCYEVTKAGSFCYSGRRRSTTICVSIKLHLLIWLPTPNFLCLPLGP